MGGGAEGAQVKEYKRHHRKVSIDFWVVVQRELRSRRELKSVKMNCIFGRITMRKLKIITV